MRFELTASPLPRECATPAPQGHFKFSTVGYGLRTLRLLTATACVLRTPLPSTSLAKLTLGSFVSGSAPQGHIFNFHDTL